MCLLTYLLTYLLTCLLAYLLTYLRVILYCHFVWNASTMRCVTAILGCCGERTLQDLTKGCHMMVRHTIFNLFKFIHALCCVFQTSKVHISIEYPQNRICTNIRFENFLGLTARPPLGERGTVRLLKSDMFHPEIFTPLWRHFHSK